MLGYIVGVAGLISGSPGGVTAFDGLQVRTLALACEIQSVNEEE